MNMFDLMWTWVFVALIASGTTGDYSGVASGTKGDYSARSWGDPHITTVDKVEYDFNGHGEYVFLQTGNTMVQVRADYMTPGNNDSTIFVAVAIKDDIGQFEAQLNRTSGFVTVYKDGVVVCSNNDSPRQGVPSNTMFPCGLLSTSIRPVRGVLVGNGIVSFSLKGFGSYLKTLTLQGGSDISITLDGIKHTISHSNQFGLAGGSVNGSMVARNGSLYTATNPIDMFAYGESWRISENESLFNYSLSSGNYSTYNTFSRPTFYEDYLTNLTTLFNLNGHQHNDSDIDGFNKTCNESKVKDECLLAIARSDDIAAGEAVNINYRHERYLYDMRHNSPPYFTDEIPVLDVYLADNHSIILNLSNYVRDNSTGDILTYTTETNIPETDFRIDKLSGLFNWTVLPSLRELNDRIQLTFTVHDKFNGTVVRDVDVNFCGCNKTSQCDQEPFGQCRCDKYVSGDYCEIPQDPCNVTTCFNQSLCNATNITVDTGPCAPCPKGRNNEFQKNIQTCDDVNECGNLYKGNDKCDVNSNCTNTDGSYICKCHHGYTLESNGFTCTDVDECKKGIKCGTSEVCRNIPGNYTCDCIGGYGRKDGGSCDKIEGFSFVFSMVWSIISGPSLPNKPDTEAYKEIIRIYLFEKLNSTGGFINVEIVNITIKSTKNSHSNRMRRNSETQELVVTDIIQLKNATNRNDLGDTVSTLLANSAPTIAGITLSPQPIVILDDGGLCSLPGKTNCATGSTECRDTNGAYECICKHGYERREQFIPNVCDDVNECLNTSYVDQCTTHGGVCHNLHGSWNCTCPLDTLWMDVGTEETPLYRCQQNHTYVGHVTFVSYFNISDSNITDLITGKMNTAFSNSTENAFTDPPLNVRQLFVKSTVIKINRTYSNYNNDYDVMFTLCFGLPVLPSTIRDVLTSLTHLGSDIHETRFTLFNDGLCSLDGKTDCDKISTTCMDTNGTYGCFCKHGYERKQQNIRNMCEDVDECLNASYVKQCTTHGGVCQNLHGSWNCTCPQHTMWKDVGTKESPLYICQKNHTYVGHVTFISVTDLSDGNIKELVTAKINAALSNNTDEATTDPPLSVRELFVYLTVLNINRTHADHYTNYDVMFTLRFGLPVSAIMLHGVLESITNLNSNINETYFTVFNESENKLCEISNECVSQSTNCLSINGAIYCECKTGFVSSESPNYCQDIDECQNTGACLHGRCENIPGSWICHCPQGYENTTSLSYSTICQDFDECIEYTNACIGDVSPIYPCVNLKGSWMCYCNSGHSVDLNVTSKLCLASTTKSPFDVSTAATPTKPSTLKSPFDVSTAATPTKPSTLKSPFDVSTAATPTKASTSTLSTTTSSITNENVSGLTTILIAIVSSLVGLVAILIILMGCMCWKMRQLEKTKLAALPQHITMDTIGPGNNYNSINQTYNSSQHTYQSVIYNHGEHGSREELSNSENHSSHQHRVSLYQTSSLPRLPPIKRDVGKWLPSGDPHRPRSPASDYLEPASRGQQPNPPSPQLDYMPHHERAF